MYKLPIELDVKTQCRYCGNIGNLAAYHPAPICKICEKERLEIKHDVARHFCDELSLRTIQMILIEKIKENGESKDFWDKYYLIGEIYRIRQHLKRFIKREVDNKRQINKEDVKHFPIDDILFNAGHIPIQKTTKYNKYKCPFHSEKTASFYVYQSNNTAHCFGCGWHSDNIAVYMKLKNCDFKTALNNLC